MSDTVIRVENLGKKYIIGHQQQERYTALRDVITNKVKSIGSLINPKVKNENPAFEEFWALKDVSFDIKQGDRVGIIGRNGAGKSTLLKILSRITEPTTGSIKIKGRVASLLEVGTGFHPELTGRENIFLNGAILGMGKEEIKRKFDEIVAFAEVEKFLDTPVKRYSSGMYVRLAFAVAAYLEPEILIVDEVLAVGDAQFQKKCLGKMEDVGKEGRTVLFVSHNLGFLQRLCSCSILLDKGTVVGHDTTKTIVYKYENLLYQDTSSSKNILERKDRKGRGRVRISEVEVFSEDMKNTAILSSGSSASFIVHFTPANKNLSCSFTIYNSNNYPISHFNSFISGSEDIYDTNSQGKFICEIDHLLLTPGTYKVNIAITSSSGHELEDHLEGAIFFEIVQGIIKGRPLDKDSGFGNTHLPHRWIIPS